MKTLPDYLRPGLDIVSIGINPSLPSVREGYYFANPRNRFWRALNASGLLFGSYGFQSGITLPDMLGVVVTILQLVATALLFRADAREWFAEPRS